MKNNYRVSLPALTSTPEGYLIRCADEWVNGVRVAGPDMRLQTTFHHKGWVLR